MKAVQIVSRGQAAFVDVPKPELQPGEALIRTKYVSLCGSDTHIIQYAPDDYFPLPPGNSGHEVIGIVEEINGENSPVQVGETALALVKNNLGMAEYAALPIENLLALPDTKSEEELLQAQQLGTVLYAAQNLPNVVNKDVAVIGQGSAGLWWVHTVRRMGARRVIAVDLQAHRLALSAQYGATDIIHNADADAEQIISDMTDGNMVDVVVEAGGEKSSINLAIDLVKKYGFIFYFGVPRVHGEMGFNMFEFFRKCARTQCMVGALLDPDHSCTRVALELIASGQADVAPMITHRFPFEKIQEAYDLQNTLDEGAVKIIVDMPKG